MIAGIPMPMYAFSPVARMTLGYASSPEAAHASDREFTYRETAAKAGLMALVVLLAAIARKAEAS